MPSVLFFGPVGVELSNNDAANRRCPLSELRTRVLRSCTVPAEPNRLPSLGGDRDAPPGGSLIPLVSVLVAVTLLAVILATIGPRLDRPRLRRGGQESPA